MEKPEIVGYSKRSLINWLQGNRDDLLRRSVLHDQAATLLRREVDRHEAEAKRLREEAARFTDPRAHQLPGGPRR